MVIKLLKRLIGRGTELTIIIILVLLFFMASIGTLSLILPRGSGLKNLVTYRNLTSLSEERAQSRNIDSNGFEVLQVATLTGAHRKVKDRPSGEIAWKDSRQSMAIQEHHSIQTLARSSATITFDELTELELGENSLVVIKGLKQDEGGTGKRVSMLILSGELRGKISGRSKNPLQVEISTPNGFTRIGSQSGSDEETSFSVKLNEDQSSTVTVFEGTAAVVTDGKVVELQANEAVTVEPTGIVGTPVALPRPPSLVAPENGATYYYRDQLPRIHFSWKESRGADGYHFVLSTDPAGNDILFETKLERPELAYGSLKAGKYYWRTSGLKGRMQGEPSRSGRVTLVQDMEPPKLDVQLPGDRVETDHIRIEGRTEAGARVLIAHKTVAVSSNGDFVYEMPLKRGLNLIVVESIDDVGNTSYVSNSVLAKY